MNMQDNAGGRRGDGDQNKAASESPKDVVQTTVDEAKEVAGEAMHTAKEAMDEVTSEASKLAKEARDKATSFAEDSKVRAAHQIDAVTMALNKAAEELDHNDQGQVAKYARDFAGGLHKVSTNLREKDINELAGTVTQFARSQPAAFIGAAALLGFAASRFAKSSASHAEPQSATSSAGYSAASTAAGPGSTAGSKPYGTPAKPYGSAAADTTGKPAGSVYSSNLDSNRNGLGSSFSKGE
jgi:hypothetical protein